MDDRIDGDELGQALADAWRLALTWCSTREQVMGVIADMDAVRSHIEGVRAEATTRREELPASSV